MGGWSIDPEPPSMYVLDEYVCLLMNKWIKVVQSSTNDLADCLLIEKQLQATLINAFNFDQSEK